MIQHKLKISHTFFFKIITVLSLSLFLVSLALFVFFSVLAPLQYSSIPHVKAAGGSLFYVSKNGNNKDGLSWHTAWNELDQINWSQIQPGDTILIDGGTSNMTYTTTLTLQKSGLPGEPITIERATEVGHTGTVTLFGGRLRPLPYCGQTTYTFQTQGVLAQGINIGDSSYIILDGRSWHGMNVYGDDGSAIVFGSNSHDDIFRNIQLYDDGSASQRSDGLWYPGPGALIDLHGERHEFQYMDMHDGGEDAFQPTNINTITVQLSWLHDSRSNPSHPGTAFNQCNHNDGMQIWTGNPVSHLTFDQDVIGPGKENGLILGNGLVSVSDVKVTNSLFIDAGANDIWGSPASKWTIDHITSFAENQNLILDGSGHSVTNSIFYGGLVSLHGSTSRQLNDCQWQTSGDRLSGQVVDPRFASNLSFLPPEVNTDIRQSPTISTLRDLDFALSPASPCRGLGASIPSIHRFLQLVGAGGTPLPTHTPTPTSVATQNPVVVATSGSLNVPRKDQIPGNTTTSSPQNGINKWAFVGIFAVICILALFTAFYIKFGFKGKYRKKRG